MFILIFMLCIQVKTVLYPAYNSMWEEYTEYIVRKDWEQLHKPFSWIYKVECCMHTDVTYVNMSANIVIIV